MKKIFLVLSLIGSLAHAAGPQRITIQLQEDAVIGGIAVRAGYAEIFQPGGELAGGKLAAPARLMQLDIPEDSKIQMESPNRPRSIELPRARSAYLLANTPFRGGTKLAISYTEYYAKLSGRVAKQPLEFPDFPSAGLNTLAFQNDVEALCMNTLQDLAEDNNAGYFCHFHLTLADSLEQKFGSQTLELPAGTRVGFEKYGISTLQLAQDEMFFGLPVSAAEPIRVNRYSAGSDPGIMSLHLSANAEYQGFPLSSEQEVAFYDADANGVARLRSFAPDRPFGVAGGNEIIVLAEQRTAYLNRDGSLHYGILAKEQLIHGIAIPEAAILFLDPAAGTISSVGLAPGTKTVIAGVMYQNPQGGTLFLDFDAQERVVRVRR